VIHLTRLALAAAVLLLTLPGCGNTPDEPPPYTGPVGIVQGKEFEPAKTHQTLVTTPAKPPTCRSTKVGKTTTTRCTPGQPARTSTVTVTDIPACWELDIMDDTGAVHEVCVTAEQFSRAVPNERWVG